MNATCPHCGATLPTDPGTTPVHAELRRFDGELYFDIEFKCGNCNGDIALEQVGGGTLITNPDRRTIQFNGERYPA